MFHAPTIATSPPMIAAGTPAPNSSERIASAIRPAAGRDLAACRGASAPEVPLPA
jgi:hypothetical protein